MNWINLGNPRPHLEPERYEAATWGEGPISYLASPQELPDVSLADVISSRHTHRKFGVIAPDDLGKFLWLSAHSHIIDDTLLSFPILHGPAPSAGAIHPIHIIIYDLRQHMFWRYMPLEHAIKKLHVSMATAAEITNEISQLVDAPQATALLFAAEPGKTFSKYKDSCSLIWRDAGALVGHMALVAESLNLAFCPLGVTGEPWCSALNDEGKLVGVGMALVGSRI